MATLSGGNYGSVGQQINKQNQTLNQINMESSPDYGKIAEEAIKGRSRERRAAIEAEARINKVGLDAMGTKKLYQIKADTDKEVADIKRPAKRFAGIVGAAGQVAGGFVLKKFSDDQKKRDEDRERKWDEHYARVEETYSRERPELLQLPDPVQYQTPDLVDPGSSTGSSTTGSSTTGGGSASPTSTASGGEVSMKYMRTLTENGYTPVQAAALVGHLRHESGDFRHMEELVPNRHGTRGYGHLQWTDPEPGNGRRTNFINWSNSQGLDPTSYEANSGFLLHEMSSGGGWNRGGTDAGFRQIGDLNTASTYLHDRYIRPSEGSRSTRITLAQETLNQWNRLQ